MKLRLTLEVDLSVEEVLSYYGELVPLNQTIGELAIDVGRKLVLTRGARDECASGRGARSEINVVFGTGEPAAGVSVAELVDDGRGGS